MPLWVYIASLLVVCVCVYLWVLERRARSKFAGIPTYPLLPFIGNVHQVLGDGKQVFQHMDRISRICDDNMSPFVVWLGPCSILVTHDPDDVKSITNAFVEKPYYYSFGRIWLGDGLVTAPGVVWKHNIKKLAGTFTSSVVDGYLEIFNAQAHRLVENLKTEVGKGPFDVIHKYLAYTTLETICQTALGVSMISESIVTTEYYDAFNRCLELIIMRAMNVLVHPDCIYRLTPAYREMVKCVEVLHNVSDTVMKKRKQEQKDTKKSKAENNNNGKASAAKFKAFLDILLELHETDATLTEQQVRSEVDTIIVGGQETVASTLFYTMLMLGSKPRVQDKMYAELRSIFGDSSSPISKEDLSRMVYCEAIINETLRLYPPVPGVLRYADRDLPLKSYTIPKGTAIAINSWGAGRSERVWGPDAKEYRPERWLEDQGPGQPGAFLAFSYGRRACIGKKYAMALLKTVLAHCVRELEFVSDPSNLELKVDIALRAVAGNLIQVKLRERK
ncbi:hypothetical protein B5X24_HaOG200063 [Helicoverpa armigera]|uniref:Cytochrome P450 n=1 Tax=Helicoverpa armigera TaxID=29058 RepID=A0A2W1BN87_HELAM|nr:hypothetical protein B5X24_HaOG200063 [Helicoverpa armigera]